MYICIYTCMYLYICTHTCACLLMGSGETKEKSVRRKEWMRMGLEMDCCKQNDFFSLNPIGLYDR